jgi:hypothetical protein
MTLTRILCAVAFVASVVWHLPVRAQQGGTSVGLFDAHSDVGDPAKPGSVDFDPASKTYQIAGGGTNMWANADAFHFVWKRLSAADVTLTADVAFPSPGGDPHRKAVLIFRQSLDADSPYVDAALHGDGLTSLQFRDARAARTS